MLKPTDRHAVLARAAQIIQSNGLERGGNVVADPFNRRSTTALHQRPMSVIGAIRCSVSGDPLIESALAWEAIAMLSRVVQVHGAPAWSGSFEDRERHVAVWSANISAEYAADMLLLVSGRRTLRAVAA